MFESTYLRFTLLFALLLAVQSQKCLNCPTNCRTCQLDPIGLVNVQCLSCANGYTFDPTSYICYSCKANEYYDPFQASCQSCPSFASCCTYNQGFLSICGCQSGYSIDTQNGICYRSCSAGQYYDPNQLACASCPSGSNCCSIKNGFLTLCGCVNGQTLDTVNDLCYVNCQRNQYYDPNFQSCLTCAPWSSPCNTTTNGVTTQGCCCNSGYTYDNVNGYCAKSCSSNQLYNYTSGQCQSCGIGVMSCAGGVVKCINRYTLDPLNNVCYYCQPNIQYYSFALARCSNCPANSNCCNISDQGFMTICGCNNGYTLDSVNQVCYKCGTTQYYSFNTGTCVNCPSFATCCSNTNGIFSICGCQSGYTIDTVNNICYRSCSTVQYYDFNTQTCASCPANANCCRVTNGFLTICGCSNGYSIDTYNGVCYKSCSAAQYYDPLSVQCIGCGTGISCCNYDASTGQFSICGCANGYTLDSYNGVCYKSCVSLQYYDPFQQTCISCPQFSTCCNYTNGAMVLCGCQSGYTMDTYNQICYKCANNQYYDVSFGACTLCPGGASCCQIRNGVVTICGCPSGYTIDSINGFCYVSCTAAQYYDASQLSCTTCPYDATCCTFTNGIVTICGCAPGQSVDPINNLCYTSCTAAQYYDANYQTCFTCPQNAVVCNSTSNGITTQSCCCIRGYSLDPTYTFCQKTCLSNQYYDLASNNCLNCPANSLTCSGGIITACINGYTLDYQGNVCYKCNAGQTYDQGTYQCSNCPAGVSCCQIYFGALSAICGCLNGYKFDALNNVCYRCSSNQYYDQQNAKCVNCPTCATACYSIQGYIGVNSTTSGQSWDPVNQICYSCTATQYYDFDQAKCASCPTCASRCTYLGGGQITVVSTVTGFTWDSFNQVCVKACSTPTYIPTSPSCSSCSGYTYDSLYGLCYKCTSVQYYNAAFGACNSCPDSSTCCTYNNGVLQICGCASGYTLDSVNQVCYKCNTGTYWDTTTATCATCPGSATCCISFRGALRICGCPRGYTIDQVNAICYESCTSVQYYDSTIQTCQNCPVGATCCTYANNKLSICGCQSGQSIDSVNMICYTNCASNQYYSPTFFGCLSCPAWSSVCTNNVNGVSTSSCCCNSGFIFDSTQTFCYKTCGIGQYYNSDSGSCVSCPKNARNCSATVIYDCNNGYTLDSFNNVCYSCTSIQYYDPTIASCTSCPTGASCCTYDNGFLSICGCANGYTLDSYNGVCYKCANGQYWNQYVYPPECTSCPDNVSCCSLGDVGLTICGCNPGYTLDQYSGVCYSCKNTQYYDSFQAQCFDCPVGASCCKYDNGFLTICACSSGYTLDTVNQVCYKCSNSQYYNSAIAACVDCPTCATACVYSNGLVNVLGTTQGQSYDSFNGICYATCGATQYYDSLQLSCMSCPFCASSCTYNAGNGQYTVPRTISGYSWNATSQLCYCSNINQYLSFSAANGKSGKSKAANTIANKGKAAHQLQYAGQVGVPSSFDALLGSTSEVQVSNNDRYNLETLTTLKPGSYADKYTLYPWTYTLKEGSDKHLESGRSTLDVTAHTMWGLNSDYCGYFEAISEELYVQPDTHMATSVEDVKHPCGHYVVFTADYDASEVSFIHLGNGAIQASFSAVLLLALFFFGL